MKRLSNAGSCLKTKKCQFIKPSLEFLGYRVDKEGFHPVEAKVIATKDAPSPTSVTELMSFFRNDQLLWQVSSQPAIHLRATTRAPTEGNTLDMGQAPTRGIRSSKISATIIAPVGIL